MPPVSSDGKLAITFLFQQAALNYAPQVELSECCPLLMTGLFDNIHAGLDQQGAIDILSTEVGNLESESDYYMAVSHLINFPGPKTCHALLAFLDKCSADVPVGLAQRKAVEVLARLGVAEATSKISSFLSCLLYTSPSPRD